MKLDLLVLDWSGVVSDDRPLVFESINYIMGEFDREPVTLQDFMTNFRPNLREIYAHWGITDYETVRRLHRDYFARPAIAPQPIPGAPEAVKALARHAPIAVFSSHPEEALLRDIWRYGLQEDIAYAIGGADKSDLADFRHLLALSNRGPGDTILYAGDTTIDVNLAHIAGIRSVAVVHPDYGYQLRKHVERFRPQPTHGIIEHIRELVPLVQNGF